MLSPDRRQLLESLLPHCVLRIDTASGVGTAFLIAPGLALTCHHVIEDAVATGTEIRVSGADGKKMGRAIPVEPLLGSDWPDLALLRVRAGSKRPCVVLDVSLPGRGQDVVVPGFPQESLVAYQTRGYTSGGNANYTGEDAEYLRIDGDIVEGGLSGAPVVNMETGFACGVVRITMRSGVPVGGFAVPVSVALERLEQVKAAYENPGPAAREWVGVLGSLHLRELRRRADGRLMDDERGLDRMDLKLEAAQLDSPLTEWTVTASLNPAKTVTVKISDLGDDVMEAIERWSRRRGYSTQDEVNLLGRMLCRALLRDELFAVAEAMLRARPPLLLRVEVDERRRLASLPWEYAQGGNGIQLGTDPAVALARFVRVSSAAVTASPTLSVLGVTVMPPNLQKSMPIRIRTDTTKVTGDSLKAILERALAAGPGRLLGKVEADLSVDDFATLLAQPLAEAWDVVHFIGAAWRDQRDQAFLAFASGRNSAPVPLATVVGKLAAARPKVVVIQLLPCPLNLDVEPLDSLDLLPILRRAGVRGLVLAQYAATPMHVELFCTALYRSLLSGDPLEVAVQTARRSLQDNAPSGDFAAFGAVSVTTTAEGDLHLLDRPSVAGGPPPLSEAVRGRQLGRGASTDGA